MTCYNQNKLYSYNRTKLTYLLNLKKITYKCFKRFKIFVFKILNFPLKQTNKIKNHKHKKVSKIKRKLPQTMLYSYNLGIY